MDEAAGDPSRAAVSGPVTLASLGVSDLGSEKLDLQRRIASLEANLAARLQERERLVHTAAALDTERISLIEQRDRVQAEAERLGRELRRVETERLRLERERQWFRSGFWRRLFTRLAGARPITEA